MELSTLLLLASAGLANAHFGVEYPPWRAPTMGSDRNPDYSQYTQPCAGVPGDLADRPQTPWPLTGGSIKLDLRHAWSYVFINLGLGDDVANFNYTLTNPFWNVTGRGTLCIPQLELPTDLPVSDGSPASLQVVTVGDDGNALYNCADIVFSEDAEPLSDDECETTEGMSWVPIASGQSHDHSHDDDDGHDHDDSDDDSSDASGNGSGEGSAGSATGVNRVALSSVVALAVVFVFGMSV